MYLRIVADPHRRDAGATWYNPSMPADPPVTQIIAELSAGDRAAAERLLPHVYEQLRALAVSFFQRQAGRGAHEAERA